MPQAGLSKHGYDGTAVSLARTVHPQHRVELGPLRVIGEDGEPPPPPSYLTITEHSIEPLPDQTGIPFWDQDWIAPELKELLFGPSEEKETELKTYFIVDAALRKKVTGFFDLDKVKLPVRCLFKGEAAQELKQYAPYLMDMTLPEGALEDRDLVPDFHKDFFKKHWEQGTGIFIRSKASMDQVLKHFRRFTRIQVEEDKRWVLFRFWDPRIAPHYFESIEGSPEKALQWGALRDEGRIEQIIGKYDAEEDEAIWVVIPSWDNLKGVTASALPMLSDTEIKGFEKYRIYRYKKRAIIFFRNQFPRIAKQLDDDNLHSIISLAYQNAKKCGVASERDHFKFLIIVAHWGSHFETDPQYYPALKTAGWITEDEYPSSTPNMAELLDFVSDQIVDFNKDLSYPKRILLGFERIYTEPLRNISYDSVSTVLYKIWPTRCQRLGREFVKHFISKAGEIGQKQLKLTDSDLVGYIALAMYFGVNFAHDPLYPWANEALALTDPDERRHKLGKAAFGVFEIIWRSSDE